jgi:hypothetical protein
MRMLSNEHTRKELMRMLSMRISALRICSACASVPYVHAQHALKGPFQIWNFYAYAEHTHKCVCSGYASVPDSYAQRTHQFLTRMLSVRIKVGACA